MMPAFDGDTDMIPSNPFVVWGRKLLEAPETALDDILSGTGARGTQQRSEPEDFLADLLTHPAHREVRTQLSTRLDAVLQEWIKSRLGWPPGQISRFGTRAYAAQVADGLRVAARLPMQATACELMRDQVMWEDRVRGLRWPGDIDLLREFDLVLVQHQTDSRFAPRWFAACDEAAWGSPYWRNRLSIGLLGLRKLPVEADLNPELMAAIALARFAAMALLRGMNAAQVERMFGRRAAAMTVLYPRHDAYWRELWSDVFDHLPVRINSEAPVLRGWLRYPTDAHDEASNGDRQRRSGSRSRYRFPLPDRTRLLGLVQDIEESYALDVDLWNRVRKLILDHWHHTSVSGESWHSVRTTINLSNRLLRLEPARSSLEQMHLWAVWAVEAESDNSYTWDLWAKVLFALGQEDACISVRWESTRRFPENSLLRNSLAYTLTEQQHWEVAESLLRDTMQDFPDDLYCRNILAGLLIRTERPTEAESLLRDTMANARDDLVSRHILARMLWQQGRRDEAETEVAALEAVEPENSYVKTLAARIRQQGAPRGELSLDELMSSFDDVGFGENFGCFRVRRTAECASTTQSRQTGQAVDETGIEWDRNGSLSAVTAFLDELKRRTPWITLFFALPVSDTRPPLGVQDMDTSEVALVAAHRAGLMQGLDSRVRLCDWLEVHPSSYSARLLLAWQGGDSGGLDKAAIRAIDDEFPEHRRWNEWLCYGFASREQRARLRQHAGIGENDNGTASWTSRLLAPYPRFLSEHDDEAVGFDGTALRRLLEDVAFAAAERAVPSIALP